MFNLTNQLIVKLYDDWKWRLSNEFNLFNRIKDIEVFKIIINKHFHMTPKRRQTGYSNLKIEVIT